MKVTANDNYNRNKNVIVFGPSGSGKSYSVAGPQLLQFNSNYVLSDPKGELLQEYGNVLLSQGYKVKVFNLKDRDKSDHYNLFAYIKNEDDILVVTKNLVKNLKEDPTAKSTADPIWEEGMTALLEALIGYVFYELEPEERNMNSVMTLLLMLESQGDGPNSVSQLDLLFDDLSINKPNSFAAKQYKLYKMAPGKTAQSINVSLGLRMSAFNIPSIANICADDTIDLHWLRMDMQVVSYIVMVEVLPFLGLGFIHRDGYPFEKLVKIYWAWHSENAAVPIRPYKESRNVQKKRTRRSVECETYCRRDEKAARKGRKAAVKAAAQIRKTIRNECRAERPQH